MTPRQLIAALKKTDNYIEDIFLYGGCYKFHLFLKTFFPEAKPYINLKGSHVVTKHKDVLYDIRGARPWHVNKDYRPLEQKDLKVVRKWSFSKNNLIKLDECPWCEEPLCYDRECKQVGS